MNKINYTCHKCKATGVKLWRLYNTFLDHQKLSCATCAGANVKEMSSDGKIPWYYRGVFMGWKHSINGLIPAIPTIEYDTFWGYTSVPPDRVQWWTQLSNS